MMGNWRLHHWKGNCPSLGLKVILGISTCLAVPAMVHLNSLLLIVVSKIILVPLHRASLGLVLRRSINGIPGFRLISPVARAPTGIFGMSAVFLRFLLHFTLYFRNPVDATLAPLSNFRYSRWPPANDRTIQLNIIVLIYYIIMQFLSLCTCSIERGIR